MNALTLLSVSNDRSADVIGKKIGNGSVKTKWWSSYPWCEDKHSTSLFIRDCLCRCVCVGLVAFKTKIRAKARDKKVEMPELLCRAA